jgi:hypothetical protein
MTPGVFGACPLAVVAAVFSDMFDNRKHFLPYPWWTLLSYQCFNSLRCTLLLRFWFGREIADF